MKDLVKNWNVSLKKTNPGTFKEVKNTYIMY